MFEFLNKRFYSDNNFEGEITGFNEKTNKLIVSGIDNSDIEKVIETDIFGSGLEQNINYYGNWEEKLYTELKNKGNIDISILSTESGDDWTVEIKKNKCSLNTNLSSVNIISYVIIVCDEVKGEILSFQETSEENEKEKFVRWINEQIEEVPEFNNTEHWETINALIISDAFNSIEEIKVICDLFYKYKC